MTVRLRALLLRTAVLGMLVGTAAALAVVLRGSTHVVAAPAPSMLFANSLIRNAADGYVADPDAESEKLQAATLTAGRAARLLETGITVEELIERVGS